ncbi:solute carrier family 26 protein [Synechococcus elongatus IITB4]|uniref:solute carrier family 26 protein n=1 Tax=Synechococcus elongatus TaxID=32046 RepID=UPI0030CFBF0E
MLLRRSRLRWLPGLRSLLHYQPAWLRGDLLAGVTVAAYLIPQCMAYGELAGLSPIVGLWAILLPLFLYTFLGSSPQLSVGPESSTAIMTAVAIAPIVAQGDAAYPAIAALMALLVGLVFLVAYSLRLGFLADLLSKPILIGYMTGIGLVMITGQLAKTSGIPITSQTPLGEIREFVTGLTNLHWPTVGVSLLVLFFLVVIQRHFPTAPGPLLAVLLATLLVASFQLDDQGVKVIGTIPAGLPRWQLPEFRWQDWPTLTASAIGVALVGYSDNILTARTFAVRHRYEIDANQELLALGVANLGNSFFQGFPISGSTSRTVIGDALGSRTQLFSLVSLGTVLLVLWWFRPVLAQFPQAALGAIVIYAATKLIDLQEFYRLHRYRRSEFWLAIVTTVGVLTTNMLIGVGVAVSLSVIDLFARLARPHAAILGEIPGMAGLHDIEDWPQAQTFPGLVIFRYDAQLCFANAEDFKRRVLIAIATATQPVQWLLLNAEAIIDLDVTAADKLLELVRELQQRGVTLTIARAKQELIAELDRVGLVERIGGEHFYPTLPTAIAAFQQFRRSQIADEPPLTAG